MPEVFQSTSEVRIQVFTIDEKNLDCWNHPNMSSLKNRMGGGEEGEKSGRKKRFFVPKVYKVYKMRQLFSQVIRNSNTKLFYLHQSF